MQRFLGILILVFLASNHALAQAKLFKWTDKNGKTHYGDVIPPEYANQGNVQMDKRGQVVKKTDAALTPEQIKAREEAEAREQKAKLDSIESQRHDKALLATYAKPQEFEDNLKRNLGQLDVQISTNQLRIKSLQGRLDNLKKQEASFVQRKQPVPSDITSGISNAQKEIDQLNKNIAKVNQDKDDMRERFAKDKARWRELKGLPPEAPAGSAPAKK